MLSAKRVASLWIAFLLIGCAGCQSSNPFFPHHHSHAAKKAELPAGAPGSEWVLRARTALYQAENDERNKRPTALDEYYEASRLSWHALETSEPIEPAYELYETSLAGLIRLAKAQNRLDSQNGLTLANGRKVPIRFVGMPWKPGEIDRLGPTPKRGDRDLLNYYQTPGVGLPMVGVHEETRDPFLYAETPFAVTMIFRPGPQGEFGLEYCDPLVFDKVVVGNRSLPLARDISSPWASAVENLPQTWFRAFFNPSEADIQAQIHMLEPYQPGKIPIILVHGLFSEPLTWALMINELKNEPDLNRNYQIWAFRYPTGGRFFMSSMMFRQQLLNLRTRLDPRGCDKALDQMVLIGHSLGGIMAKIQVTDSGDAIWNTIARGPFEQLQGPPELLTKIRASLFFHPSPTIQRVIFIGTPHHGAKLATGFLARSGERLISFDSPEDQQLKSLIAQNNQLLNPNLMTTIPTTLDMLEPNHPLLETIRKLPIAPWVKTHSVIGTGGWVGCREQTDGIVPVESAEHPTDVSSIKVRGIHTHLHRNPDSIKEVIRILEVHAREARWKMMAETRMPQGN